MFPSTRFPQYACHTKVHVGHPWDMVANSPSSAAGLVACFAVPKVGQRAPAARGVLLASTRLRWSAGTDKPAPPQMRYGELASAVAGPQMCMEQFVHHACSDVAGEQREIYRYIGIYTHRYLSTYIYAHLYLPLKPHCQQDMD